MDINLILPLSIFLGVLSFSLIARWYVMPFLISRPLNEALVPLILPHCFRYVGMVFLIPGVTSRALDPRFANPAAYGDLIAAVLAILAIFALRLSLRSAIPLVWLFNIEGTLDLFNALFQGLRYTENGHLGAAYFIPAVIVPVLLVTHYMVFILLLRKSGTSFQK